MPGSASVFEGCEKELERCNDVYNTLVDASPFISAVYRVVDEYLKSHPLSPLDAPGAKDAEDLIRRGESLTLNPLIETKIFVELLEKTANATLESNPALEKKIKELQARLERFLADQKPQISLEFARGFHRSLCEEGILEKDLATFLFTITLSSLYRQYLTSLIEVVRPDLWTAGWCPSCGEKPHFGMLRRKDNAKILECWLCGTQWAHRRICCPYCDNQDHEEIGYFTVDDNDACRVSFCNVCHNYYKVFDLREFDVDEVSLTIHNLATLSYDVLARQEGFSPGSGLEWVNNDD